ncbi:77 kDa echinoderm microtubule-associated protein-like isoform X2 [Patiria miniata]|uniref:Doublecortin domain-containing protein n=1 Tax=Patiria miniata TaxID=46514 RepID=A0A914BR50_PATMI|nr:77 kDa echinoderm microtubule-associated protein-like isoform X2 [Patiria miniata]
MATGGGNGAGRHNPRSFLEVPEEVRGVKSISPRRRFKLSPVNPAYRPDDVVSSRYSVTSSDEERESPSRGWRSEGEYDDHHRGPLPDLRTGLEDDYRRLEELDVPASLPRYNVDTMIRYEPPAPPKPAPHEGRFTTKVVTFYRNGDKHFKGVTLPVNQRNFRLWDTLLKYLAEKIHLPYGVRYVYSLGGDQITSIAELVDGRAYVCASGQFAKNIPYGRAQHADRPWLNQKPSEGVRGADRELYQNEPSRRWHETVDQIAGEREPLPTLAQYVPHNPNVNSILAIETSYVGHAKPRMVLIISNTHRTSRASILLNPKTTQSFEQVLRDMTSAIVMTSPPVKQLFTWRTEEPVLSFTQLFRDFKNHDKFIACGLEPIRRTANFSDSSTETEYADGRGRFKGSLSDGAVRERDGKYASMHRRKVNRRAKGLQRNGVASSLEVYNADESNSPRSSLEDSPRLPPMKPRRAFGSSDGSDPPSDRRKLHRQYPSQKNPRVQDEVPMEIGDPNKGYNLRQRKPAQQGIEMDSEDSTPERSLEAAGPGARERGRKRGLAAPVTVEIHGQVRQFLPPSIVDPRNTTRVGLALNKRLKLDWVYGYRGFDHCNNLFVLPSGELLYYVGAVGVLYDKDTDRQRHYTGHNEDITSMAVHPNGTHVATGQLAGQLPDSTPRDIAMCHSAHIRVWEVETLHTHAILGLNFFDAGIACLSFSNENNGDWLLAVEQGTDHLLSVWEWNNDTLLAKSKEYTLYDAASTQTAGADAVVVGSFHPFDDSIIVTAGRQHLFFWSIVHRKIVRDKKSGNFDNQRPSYVTCLEFSHTGDVLTGDSSGNITVWEKDNENVFRARHCIQHAHERSVFALCMLEDGTLLSGGGLDRRLQAWDSLQGYSSANIERLFTESAGGIRAIVPLNPGSPDGRIILGTTRNHIMEGSLQTKFIYVLQSHCQELWAVAAHPNEQAFATAGYDKYVMLWQADSHKLLWKSEVEKPCVSCAFNPSASVLAVGTTVGRFTVLNAYDGMHITSVQAGSQQLDAVHFSPDGGLLVLGSHDHKIYLYTVLDDGQVYRKAGFLQGHTNYVKQIDWSADGSYLQSVSGDYDLRFWDVTQMKKEKAEAVRDIVWQTQTCALGYTVSGIWPGRENDIDVNSVDRSRTGSLLATGDSSGWLSLYRHPCTSLKAASYDVKSHSAHVTAVRFLADDSCVISAGGADAVLMQWSIAGKGSQWDQEGALG